MAPVQGDSSQKKKRISFPSSTHKKLMGVLLLPNI